MEKACPQANGRTSVSLPKACRDACQVQPVQATNAGGAAAFLFFRKPAEDGGATGVHALAFSPGGEATALRDVGLHDSVAVLSGETAFEALDKVKALLDGKMARWVERNR